MNIFIFTPAFLIFIYCLFKFVKDDYVLIRKNVSTEQVFDILFSVSWIGLLFSRLFSFILHPSAGSNFLSFFSLQVKDFSLPGLVIGWMLGLYLVSQYKKFPTARLFDFFSSSFVTALPVGFLSYMLFFKEYILLLYFLNAVVFSVFAFYFIKHMSFKLIIFIMFLSSILLIDSVFMQTLNKHSILSIENVLLSLCIILSLIFYFRKK